MKYLCKTIPEDEWSGILLYEVKGSIRDVEKLSLVVKDIIPMDKGSRVSTQYEFIEVTENGVEDKMMDYIENFPEALNWKMGHIHSHNTMSVFFSNIDMSELHDNVHNHDFYLSLIVNNWGDYEAKVVTKGIPAEQQIVINYTANDENGNPYIIAAETTKELQNVIFIYDCDIEKEDETSLQVDDFFDKNVKDILEKAKVKKQSSIPKHYNQSFRKTSNSLYNNFTKNKKKQNSSSNHQSNFFFSQLRLDEFEDFLKNLLLGVKEPEDDYEVFDLEDVLTQIGVNIQVNQITATELSSTAIRNYFELYNYYFGTDDDDEVSLFSNKIISILEDYKNVYPFLKATISGLKALLINYIKNDKYKSKI